MASRHFPQHITVSTSNLPDGFDVEHQLFKHHAIRSPSNPFDLQSRPVKHINGINPSHPLAKSETVNTQLKSNPATSNLEGIAIFRSLPVQKANATASTAIFRSLLVPKQMRPLAGHHRPFILQYSHLPIFASPKQMRLPAHQPFILQLSLLFASAQANAAAGRASPTFHFEHNLLFANAKAYTTAGRALPTFHFEHNLLFANAKAYTTAGRASLTFHFEHNLLLFANAKAYTTAGRASPTFRFATQSTTFRSSPVLKCMRPLAELASTLSTPHYGTFVQPI